MLGSKVINNEDTTKHEPIITTKEVVGKEIEENKTKESVENNKEQEIELKHINLEEIKERKSNGMLSSRVELKEKLEPSPASEKHIKKKTLDPKVKSNFREEVTKMIQSLGVKSNINSEEYVNEVNKGLSNIMEKDGIPLCNP